MEGELVALVQQMLSQTYPQSENSYSLKLLLRRHCQGLASSTFVEVAAFFTPCLDENYALDLKSCISVSRGQHVHHEATYR